MKYIYVNILLFKFQNFIEYLKLFELSIKIKIYPIL